MKMTLLELDKLHSLIKGLIEYRNELLDEVNLDLEDPQTADSVDKLTAALGVVVDDYVARATY